MSELTRKLAGYFMVSEGITAKQKIPAMRVHDLLEKFDGMTPVEICEAYENYMNSLKKAGTLHE